MTDKLCAVSVDLDPLTAYYDIHGLGDPPRQLRETIMRRVLPRFERLFDEAGVRATLFVIGRVLERSEVGAQTMRRMVEAGHEVGNHTYSHPYDLCRQSEAVIDEEIGRAHETISSLVGEERAPVGFRAPGYFINAKVIEVLAKRRYRYDSSMFPSPPYYLAKAAVMAGMALRGRRSASVLHDPRGLSCPADPYRPDWRRPWARGSAPLVELPIAVMPTWRVPAIGTLFAAGPSWVRRPVLQAMVARPLFNLELHGIDLADAVDDRIPTALAGRQPDLRIPMDDKFRIFKALIEELKATHRFVTLAGAADALEQTGAV